MQGTVLLFQRLGGWGFITGDDDEDYFVHHSGLIGRNSLKPGQRVEFEPSTRNGKPLAINVQVIGEAPPYVETQRILSGTSSNGGKRQ